MANDKAFRTMNELVSALAQAERELGQGALGLEGLEQACGDARELYERLVILRHKAREAAVQTAPAPVPPPTPPAQTKKEEAPSVTAEPPAMRLDTRPPESTPRQVSLIEAIEATEQVSEGSAPSAAALATPAKDIVPAEPARGTQSSAAAPASKSAPSLAEKLEKASINDLSKAISLSHKFWFVAELFNGDRITYDKTIERLNAMASHAEAQGYLQSEVLDKLRKPADPEALATFQELVKRRHA